VLASAREPGVPETLPYRMFGCDSRLEPKLLVILLVALEIGLVGSYERWLRGNIVAIRYKKLDFKLATNHMPIGTR
jgi:hypothetical protein